VTYRTLPFELLGSGMFLSGNASQRRAALRIWRVPGQLVQGGDETRTLSECVLMGFARSLRSGPRRVVDRTTAGGHMPNDRADPGREPNAFCPAFCRQPVEAQRRRRRTGPMLEGRGVVLW